MSDDRYSRLKDLVIRARDMRSTERAAFLQEVCQGDDALRHEVEELLVHDVSLDVLQTAAFGSVLPDAVSHVADESLDRIGPYRLTTLLGEGGMGVVYRAEQTEPIKRSVAVKLVRRGMDTDRIVARFALERQTLALMNHPFIAHVFDAGATGDGRPFFVMELVEGLPITRYAADRGLDLQARLQLFLDVCQGVRHAHQRGVIHRDLKPSNVLVSEQGGMAIPKIIDFGIAKAFGEVADDLTQSARIGTPAYMSPEQAGAVSAPVDTRTDVYALGVLLYELLSGRTPYAFDSGAPAELLRVLRDTTPLRPSIAVQASAGGVRASHVKGDLDSIVLKAIERDPELRYASVEQLTDDIERHLQGLPVQAQAATWRYRASKFVTRHRVAVAAAAFVILALTASLIAVTSSLVVVRRERDASNDARDMADATTAFLVEMLGAANPRNRPAGSTTELRVRDVLDDAVKRLSAGSFATRPQLEARMRFELGRSYSVLGTLDPACEQMQRAIDLNRNATSSLDPATLAMLDDWADCEARAGRADKAVERLLPSTTACAAEPPPAEECRYVMDGLATLRFNQAKYAEAEIAYRRALTLSARLAPDDRQRLRLEFGLARAIHEQGRYSEAEPLYRSVIERQSRTLGDDHVVTLDSVQSLGILYGKTDRMPQALALYERVAAGKVRTLGPDSDATLQAQNQLAGAYCNTGRLEDCRRLIAQVVDTKARTLGERHPSTILSTMNLASTLVSMKREAEALPLLEASVERAKQSLPAGHVNIGLYLLDYASTLMRTNRWSSAEAPAREAYDRIVAARGERFPDVKAAAMLLAEICERTGRSRDAAAWREKANGGSAAESPPRP